MRADPIRTISELDCGRQGWGRVKHGTAVFLPSISRFVCFFSSLNRGPLGGCKPLTHLRVIKKLTDFPPYFIIAFMPFSLASSLHFLAKKIAMNEKKRESGPAVGWKLKDLDASQEVVAETKDDPYKLLQVSRLF